MDITGKIIAALPEQSGTSRQGNPWRKREYVLETQETYPKKVHFHFFGDRIDQYPLQVGQVITLSFDLSSREYNGRWYTDVAGWKAVAAGQEAPAASMPAAAPAPAAMPGGYANAPVPPAPLPGQEPGDDLPF